MVGFLHWCEYFGLAGLTTLQETGTIDSACFSSSMDLYIEPSSGLALTVLSLTSVASSRTWS